MLFPSRFRDVERVRAEHGAELVDELMATAFLTDEPADRVVERFRTLAGGEGWRRLDSGLATGEPTGVAEIDALLAPALEPPAWVDFELVDAGAIAWWRVGSLPQLLALTSGSLAAGYGVGSLARPLAATGRLTQMAPRRLGETARWVTHVTRPGMLRPGAPGVAATVRLRLVHALVRAHLRAREDWDVANWGEPISVGDTIATGMLGFFVVPLDALEDMGVRYRPAELEAINHLWRWICFLMGAPEEHLPLTYRDTVQWAEAARALDSGPIEESAALLRALLFHGLAFERTLPRAAVPIARYATAHAFGALARRWMGDERADQLQAPDTPLKHLVPLLRPITRARNLVLATGVLGSEERIVALELALSARVMAAAGTVPAAIAAEAVERAPVLRAA